MNSKRKQLKRTRHIELNQGKTDRWPSNQINSLMTIKRRMTIFMTSFTVTAITYHCYDNKH